MNWPDLLELKRKAESGEMTKKQASDLISVTWALIVFHRRHKLLFPDNWEQDYQTLQNISLAIWKRMHS